MKVNITIPETLNDITVSKYLEYLSIVKANEDATNDFLNKKMVQIFCNIPLSIVNSLQMKDFRSIVTQLNNVFKSKPKDLITRFNLNGVEYGFIPDLDNITAGEFADLDNYFQEEESLNKAMAVLYRPVVKPKWYKKKTKGKYNIEKYEGSSKYANVFKDMPLDVAISAQVFFYNLEIELSKSILRYLQQQVSKQKTNGLERNGDGINRFIQSLEEAIFRLNEYQSRDFMRC